MQTSRFQLGLIATLAVGLGFSLASSDAVGYPAGAVVSLGSNPTFSMGGELVGATMTTLDPTEWSQQMVVTDVVLTIAQSNCSSTVELVNAAELRSVAAFKLFSSFTNNNGWGNPHRVQPTGVSHSFESGLPSQPGTAIELVNTGDCTVGYTLSGYYAQP